MIQLFHRENKKQEAFGQLFAAHYPRLLRYAVQLMGDREEACDLVSGVMEQAWRQFDGLDTADCGGYLYVAVRNSALNRLKHLRVEQENLEVLREATRADVESNYREHEALLQLAERIARSLPEPTRTVLHLCYYRRLTYREAGECLGISPDTVKKHLSKALRMLREAMNRKDNR